MKITRSIYSKFLKCESSILLPETSREQVYSDTNYMKILFGEKLGVTTEYANFPFWKDTETLENIKSGKSFINGSLQFEDLSCSIDAFQREEGKNVLYLVKTSSKTIEQYRKLLSYTNYVVTKLELKIDEYQLVTLEKKKLEELDFRPLFAHKLIPKESLESEEEVSQQISRIVSILNKKIALADLRKCFGVKACSNTKLCYEHSDEETIFDLRNGGENPRLLFASGKKTLDSLDGEIEWNRQQKIQITVAKTKQIHIESENLNQFLNSIQYPIFAIDFEAVISVFPPLPEYVPHEPVPFCFTISQKKSVEEPFETSGFFVEDVKLDSLEKLFSSFMNQIGDRGTILCFDDMLEKKILKKLFELFPNSQTSYDSLAERIVDIATPFEKFWVYHDSQKGSTKLKDIDRTFGFQAYANQTILNGLEAQNTYLSHLRIRKNVDVLNEILSYCKKDSEILYSILDFLESLRGQYA